MIATTEWRPEYGPGSPAVGVVYGFRMRATGEFRYVGLTTKPVERRIAEHVNAAKRGRRLPLYDWMRKTDAAEYEVVVLEHVTRSREDLGLAEESWITYFRTAGDRLMNLADGGAGSGGVKWTAEQRAAASVRQKGRKGVSLPGPRNPHYGKRHTAEQRQKWSEERKGTNTGERNPNFGKFGADHPSFGRRMSEESKQRLSEMRVGELNPNFGKAASDETRAKMSAARRGKPMPSSVRSAHTRWHTNKGVFSETCRHCIDDAARRAGENES
ncbi:hypothetical protein ARHIZOSPH14_09120 [Agromyces rhizosphaerae]|uniref:GIY-YIG domain-containing protein n=1 Tax=Agromyces rhizosphaerae TaxID=88374 RepID=A0A9W6FNQ2_9MICO|nr:NUMOD3 domain-containing DNA-binding protein [Agromyces rhizosphaerae]GLI26670.1 hypothetical protein ARHIZOSPH14_09120 [Agromyces rhizosphaerae]